MGVEQLHQLVEAGHVEGVVVPVELLKISRACAANPARIQPFKKSPPQHNLSLILDAECCLDRLYGGFFSDWACGGQWNRMLLYLQQLVTACAAGSIELVVAFNGAIEQQRLSEWVQKQQKYHENVTCVLRHVQNKGTPPPKVWWVPPTCLHTALRMALRHFGIPMLSTMDDHHQEVLAYCRENKMTGIIGDDGEYFVFDPPRLFSGSSIKLTYKGAIETKEYLISLLASKLELTNEDLCILGALLGSYLISEAQLTDLYSNLNISATKDLTNIVKTLATFVKSLQNKNNLESLAFEIFGPEKGKRNQGFIETVQYYLNGTKDGFLKYRPCKLQKKEKAHKDDADSGKKSSDEEALASEGFAFASDSMNDTLKLEDAMKKMALSGTMEIEDAYVNGISKEVNGEAAEKVEVRKMKTKPPADVLRTASERHLKGFMSPYIYQVLTQGEIKLPVLLEDDRSNDMISIHNIYRPVRQSVYAILYNVHHQMYLANNKDKDSGQSDEKVSLEPPTVKEWVYPYTEPDIVKAEPLYWGVPTVQRLWLGGNADDTKRRIRAFFSCLRSDSPLILSASYVPQYLLVMAAILRYLMQVKPPVLRQLELDAFLVTAFSPDLLRADANQDLQLHVVSPRGIQLATLFMQGVETALLVNDACGAPIPFPVYCPWNYFDGKFFHHILNRAENVKSLQELCNHRMDIVVKVERMRHAILEDLNVSYARRVVFPITTGVYPTGSLTNGIPPAGYNPPPHAAPAGANSSIRAGGPAARGGSATLPYRSLRGPPRKPVDAHGGHLEVAGVVVCKWGPNYGLARGRKGNLMPTSRSYPPPTPYHPAHPPYPHGPPNYRGYNVNVKRRAGGGTSRVPGVSNFRKTGKVKKPVEEERKKDANGTGRGIVDSNSVDATDSLASRNLRETSNEDPPEIGQFDLNDTDL